MGTYLGRLCPHPEPWVPGGQRGAHPTHLLVSRRRPVVRSPPCCPKYLRIWQPWPIVALLRLCLSIPRALGLFLGILISFCRRRHQRACGQRRVMWEQEQDSRVLEREAHQETGPEDQSHRKPQASLWSSCYNRNAVTSSYSSIRGFPLVEKWRQPATCQPGLPQRLTKTVIQQGPQVPSSSCALSQRQSQPYSGPGDIHGQRPSFSSGQSPQRKSQPYSGPGDTLSQRPSSSSFLSSQGKSQTDHGPGHTPGQRPSFSSCQSSQRKNHPDHDPGDIHGQRPSCSNFPSSQRKGQPDRGPGDTPGQSPPCSSFLSSQGKSQTDHGPGHTPGQRPSFSSGQSPQRKRQRYSGPGDIHGQRPSCSNFPSSQRKGQPDRGPGDTPGQSPPCSSFSLSKRKRQPDRGPGDTHGKRPSSRSRSPSCDRPRKRKFPLLPQRLGDPLGLPPAPVLGYTVRPEDLDAEKRALWQRFSSSLRGDPETSSGSGAPEPLRSSPQPASGTAPAPIASIPWSTSLPVTSAGSTGPSGCTPTPMAPKPALDSDVTPMDITPADTTPMDPTPMDTTPADTTSMDPTPMDTTPADTTSMDPTPMDTTPADTSMDPTPMDTTPPSYAHSSGAPPVSRGGKQAAVAPAQAPTSTPGQPGLSTTTQATLGTQPGTHLGTQPGTQASTQASTGTANAALGPSASATQSFAGSWGRNSRKRAILRTLVATRGHNPQNNPVLGGTTVPMLTPILGGAPKHSTHPSSKALGATSKVPSSGVYLPASNPSYLAAAMGTSRAGGTTGLPNTWAAGAGPSTSKSTGLAPKPASHTDVTPMDTTPPK